MTTKPPFRFSFTLLALLVALLSSACGSDGALDGLAADVRAEPTPDPTPLDREVDPETTIDSAEIVYVDAGDPGLDPFTVSVSAVRPPHAADPTGNRGERAPGLYGGSGDDEICDVELLIDFLLGEPDKAAAWAEVNDIDVDDIREYIRSLEPVILETDTRVTNHGYRDGRARPFQATLAAGTAVLVDTDGVPRARCACGNPLDEPVEVPGQDAPEPAAPPSTTTIPDEPVADELDRFCDVWAEVAPSVVGGPTGSSNGAVDAYLDTMADAFTRLVAAAEATPAFPADALVDLVSYRDALAAAAASETLPGPGDAALRDRIEEFIVGYCDEPTVPVSGTDDPAANCGSMQFFLLVAAAEELGIDHDAVSAPYVEALELVVASADPGSEFEPSDVAPMLDFEDVGCHGAVAMQQLFADLGMAHLIEGTDLGA